MTLYQNPAFQRVGAAGASIFDAFKGGALDQAKMEQLLAGASYDMARTQDQRGLTAGRERGAAFAPQAAADPSLAAEMMGYMLQAGMPEHAGKFNSALYSQPGTTVTPEQQAAMQVGAGVQHYGNTMPGYREGLANDLAKQHIANEPDFYDTNVDAATDLHKHHTPGAPQPGDVKLITGVAADGVTPVRMPDGVGVRPYYAGNAPKPYDLSEAGDALAELTTYMGHNIPSGDPAFGAIIERARQIGEAQGISGWTDETLRQAYAEVAPQAKDLSWWPTGDTWVPGNKPQAGTQGAPDPQLQTWVQEALADDRDPEAIRQWLEQQGANPAEYGL